METGYYIANEVNGIWFEGDCIDDTTTELLSVSDFYEALPRACSNIACFLDTEYPEDVAVMELIQDEYGIDGL